MRWCHVFKRRSARVRISFSPVRRPVSSGSHPSNKHYDVLVNGGGIVGAVFASSLLRQLRGAAQGPTLPCSSSFRIGIIEPRAPPTLQSCLDKPSPDLRVYAMAPKSIRILDSIGSWQHIAPRSQPYTSMQVWESSGPGMVRFNAPSADGGELGRIVEDSTVQAAVYQSLKDSGSQCEYLFGHKITKLAIDKDAETGAHHNVKLELSSTAADGTQMMEPVTCSLLVGADGAASSVRTLSGGSSWGWNYGQEAIVATVKISEPHSTAWQRYLATGPLALLPLWNGYSSIVWSLPVSEARRVKDLPQEDFLRELNAALQGASKSYKSWEATDGLDVLKREMTSLADAVMSAVILSSGTPDGAYKQPPTITELASARVGFSLQLQQARSYVSPRVALIGDAAHSIHPQAGQGLNLGIADAESLARAVASTAAVGGDIGDVKMLQSLYGRPQYNANLAMMSAVDGLNRLFGYDGRASKLVQLARGAGMLALNSPLLGPLKEKISSFAMGHR